MTTQTFSTEKIVIDEFVEEYFKKTLVPLLENMKIKYKLGIDGPISAGKSTALECFYTLGKKYGIKFAVLPEYINADPTIGSIMLERFIKKEITNATFQNYILDTYSHSYSRIIKENSDYNIMLMERVPDDSILIFANITNRNYPEDLNEQTLFALYNKMVEYNNKCSFPSYFDNDTKFVEFIGDIDDIMINIIDIVADDIKNGIEKRIIGLNVNTDVCVSRIKRRGRPEEQNYDKSYLAQLIHAYNEIYKIKKINEEHKQNAKTKEEIEKINKKYSIRFTNIGRLIDEF